MKMIAAKDGKQIAYKDWGEGRPVLFCHGWPLSSDAWDAQMMFLGARGFRVIAHDRRSHGRSEQTWNGNDMNTYADDLGTLVEHLDLHDVTLVGHSTGGGEVVRYLSRHGASRVRSAVLISAIPPLILKTEQNPEGLPMEVFDNIREGVRKDRSQFYKGLAIPFFNGNRPDAKLSDGERESFWLQGMMGGTKGQHDCIKQFSETDFTEELKGIEMPVLILHGDDDQIVPYRDSALLSVKLLPKGYLKIYPGFGHGMPITEADTINSDLLSFCEA